MPLFRVWAPLAEHRVSLVVEDREHPMHGTDGGWWEVEAPAGQDSTYAFSLDGGEPRPDPRGLRLPDGVNGWSARLDIDAYAWSDADWRGVHLPGAVIYELHVGTFTEAGTLDSATERLDHLVDLGVDLVEVMPLNSFPGRHGWGYDGVGLFAVHEPYGGPVAFQRFVDACHARGLGVCLDVVYNHTGPTGDYLHEFGPYFTEAHTTPWGPALNLDGPGSDEVRRFVLDNARMWLCDFHVDALRLDAVHALVDERAISLLEEMSQEVDTLSAQLGRPLWLIAESDRNDPRTVTPRQADGMGLHAQWADDVHHALHVLLTGETQGYYADFAAPEALVTVLTEVFLHAGTWSSFRGRHHGRPVDVDRTPGWRFVASLQNHDQVGNRAIGDRLSESLSPGVLACGAALLLTSAFTPMLFMGEEWGACTPWQYFTDHIDPHVAELTRQGRRAEFGAHGWSGEDVPDPQDSATVERSRLDWSEIAKQPHARLLAWYRDLLALRRAVPDLRDPRLRSVDVTRDDSLILVRRGGHLVAVNLTAEARDVPVGEGATFVLAWDDAASLQRGSLSLPAQSACIVRA